MRKKFAWFFCIFMSSLVLLSCSEDNKKEKNPETVREEELLRGILKLILKRPIPICLLTLTKM